MKRIILGLLLTTAIEAAYSAEFPLLISCQDHIGDDIFVDTDMQVLQIKKSNPPIYQVRLVASASYHDPNTDGHTPVSSEDPYVPAAEIIMRDRTVVGRLNAQRGLFLDIGKGNYIHIRKDDSLEYKLPGYKKKYFAQDCRRPEPGVTVNN
jgi:hypothetical protein